MQPGAKNGKNRKHGNRPPVTPSAHAQGHRALKRILYARANAWDAALLQELARLYTAFCAGRTAGLGELALQYADYAVWQRSWLTDEALERQLDYWKGRLAGMAPVLDLPADRPRPAVRGGRGEAVPLTLPDEVGAALLKLGRSHGATSFMVALAAFQVLLGRYTGRRDRDCPGCGRRCDPRGQAIQPADCATERRRLHRVPEPR